MSKEYEEYQRGYTNGNNDVLDRVYEDVFGALIMGRLKSEDDLKKILEPLYR